MKLLLMKSRTTLQQERLLNSWAVPCHPFRKVGNGENTSAHAYPKHKHVVTAEHDAILYNCLVQCADQHHGLSLSEAQMLPYHGAVKFGIARPEHQQVGWEDWI